MINIKSKVILIFGIIVAGIALMSNHSMAATSELETTEMEQYALVASLVNDMAELNVLETTYENVYKVYNADNRLVYESRSEEDPKLKSLMNKSDLLTNVDQVYYYKLSH
jgi:hypothetical protein